MADMSAGNIDRQRALLTEYGYLAVGPGTVLCALFGGMARLGQQALLAPADRSGARSWSLSGMFGRDAFPWHTDGAISSHPPHWLVLRPVRLSEPTFTELLDPGDELRQRLARTILLARDHVGRARYLPALVPMKDGYRIRWDSRTCQSRSRAVAQEVAMAAPTATIWWRLDLTLVIDNYRLLHRRPAVSA